MNYYQISWLEYAIQKFKLSDSTKMVLGVMTIEEFIKKYCEEELSKMVNL